MDEARYPAPDPRDVDPAAVRRGFSRAASTYDSAAALQREVGARMAQRLDYVKLSPSTILDAGCGTGDAVGELAVRYPGAHIVAFDIAQPMVEVARRRTQMGRSLMKRLLHPLTRTSGGVKPAFVCADMNALPFRGVVADLAWSNLALQWVNDLPRAFAEFRRVLKVGGLLSFTTLGPDTLHELRRAFSGVDETTHVNRFVDMHDIGDMLVHAGFADPVMDMEYVTLTFDSPRALLAELKSLGATNRTRGRPRGLMGRTRFERALAALEALRRDGRIPATYEVVYGHAWKGEPRKTAEGHAIVRMRPRERGA
ncbi:MAG TPA: malonyl-ACP O-methyltransferase BioC [Casimicrobiaceae bacterium]|nr:malonyl-ACP O-methyltransferase BioC [Casimicrobiaceae bacterium]